VSDYEKGIEAATERSLAGGLTHVAWVPFEVWMSDRIGRFLAVQPEVWWCEEHKVSSKRSGFCVLFDREPIRDQRECVMVKARLVVTP